MRYIMKASLPLLMAACTVIWLCPHPAAAASEDAPNLFTAAPPAAANPQETLEPETVRSRPVQVDLSLLQRSVPNQRMTLNFMGDKAYTGVVEQVEKRAPRQSTIRGRLEGIDGSSFIMVQHKDAVAGVFRFPDSPRLFNVRVSSGGAYLVTEIDTSQYPPEQCFTGLPQGGAGASAPAAAVAEAQPEAVTAGDETGDTPKAGDACAEPATVLDVMIVYTPQARNAMGGTHAAAIAQGQLAVEVGQQAYNNSLVAPRLRLVYCGEVNRTEANDMDADLDWLTNPYVASQVHADRDTYGADFVSMMVSYGSGLGWCGGGEGKAFTVVKYSRAVNTWTLVHEIGHNQGCDHNREDAASGCHASSYSYGYYWTGNSGPQWGSVMSYLGNRVAHFSNPNVLFDGQPTGIPAGDPGEAYNVRTMNNGAWWHEGFRLTRFDVWTDFNRICFFTTCNGSFTYPFSTLVDAVDAIPPDANPSELPSLWIRSSASDETMTINKPMVLRACNGAATIGATP